MSALNEGVYGAKVQSWRESNPRDMLWRIMKELPTKKEAFKQFMSEIKDPDNEDYLDVALEYWFTLNYRSLSNESVPAVEKVVHKQQKQREVEEVKEEVQAVIRKQAMILLDFVMPNDKALRDCTGTEVAKFGGKFVEIGQKAGKRKVGAVLTDDDLRKLQAGK